MARYIALIILNLISGRLSSSPQLPDYIIYNNDTIATYNLILEQFLNKTDALTTQSLFGLSFREGASLNCWRGYQAIYKIDNDSLFLADIITCGSKTIDKNASNEKMRLIFGADCKDNKVYINWFSGNFSFPLNNNLIRWDGVFYQIYEKEKVISVEKGKIIKVENVINYEHKPNGINRKNKTNISAILFKKLKKVKWESLDKFDCSHKYLITINTEGKVSKVTMLGYDADEKMEEHWKNEEHCYCVTKIYGTLSKLNFDIIKSKGKPISENIYLYIWFDLTTKKIENWTHH